MYAKLSTLVLARATATRTALLVRSHGAACVQRSSSVWARRVQGGGAFTRAFSGSRAHLHGSNGPKSVGAVPEDHLNHDHDDHDHDHDDHVHDHDHDHDHDEPDDEDDDDDMEDVVDIGPMGKEYGGPQRGGKFKEPTRFGDWERKGRCTDF